MICGSWSFELSIQIYQIVFTLKAYDKKKVYWMNPYQSALKIQKTPSQYGFLRRFFMFHSDN